MPIPFYSRYRFRSRSRSLSHFDFSRSRYRSFPGPVPFNFRSWTCFRILSLFPSFWFSVLTTFVLIPGPISFSSSIPIRSRSRSRFTLYLVFVPDPVTLALEIPFCWGSQSRFILVSVPIPFMFTIPFRFHFYSCYALAPVSVPKSFTTPFRYCIRSRFIRVFFVSCSRSWSRCITDPDSVPFSFPICFLFVSFTDLYLVPICFRFPISSRYSLFFYYFILIHWKVLPIFHSSAILFPAF